VLEVLRERTEHELAEDLHALQPEEAAVLAMLQQRLRHEQEQEEQRGRKRSSATNKETNSPRKRTAVPVVRRAA
jgi:DNA topoisomerase-1